MNATVEAASTNVVRNGIKLADLQGAIDAVRADPAAGQTQWAVNSRWMGGTRSEHAIDGCTIGGNEIDRKFKINVDEPLELCGENKFANPQEYLLSAINACMIVGYAAAAALMGVKLTKLEIQLGGDIDLRGFLGLDPTVPAGYDSLKQTVTIAGDGTAEQFQQIHAAVKRTSPNYFNITREVATNTRLVVE
jgi:uncharacterized OsmC-like protein